MATAKRVPKRPTGRCRSFFLLPLREVDEGCEFI